MPKQQKVKLQGSYSTHLTTAVCCGGHCVQCSAHAASRYGLLPASGNVARLVDCTLRSAVHSALGVNANGAHMHDRYVCACLYTWGTALRLVRSVDVSGAPFGMRIMGCICGWCCSACAYCGVQCMCRSHMCSCYKAAHSTMHICMGKVWRWGIEFRVQGCKAS